MRRSLVLSALIAVLAVAAAPSVRAATWYEKDINLDEALRLRDLLAARGFDVLLTRDRDVSVPLANRTGLANERGAHAFVSVHNNASTNTSARGTEVYHQIGNSRGYDLALAIVNQTRQRTPVPVRGVYTRQGQNGDYYFVLRTARMTSVLFEGAYLSNRYDMAALAQPGVRRAFAEAIAVAVEWWFGPLPDQPRADNRPPRTDALGATLDPPSGLRAGRDGDRVTVRWQAVRGATGYVLWRDGQVLREIRVTDQAVPLEQLTAASPSGDELVVEDRLSSPGVHHYEVRAFTEVLGQTWKESPLAGVDVRIPWLVVVDPGHGGSDPGAIGRL